MNGLQMMGVAVVLAAATPAFADEPKLGFDLLAKRDARLTATALTGDRLAKLVAAVAVPKDNLTKVGQGTLAFVWERNGLRVPLEDRIGRWTDRDARWVSNALDQLPDLFIRKAIRGGMKRIYRDGALPTAPTDHLEKASDREGRGGVAVPAGPWSFVAVGDNLFADEAHCYKVTTHELGHCVQWDISGWATPITGTSGWTGISWTTGIPTIGLRSWNGFVSNYSRKTHMEDFAECAAWYWLDPDKLLSANPAKFAFMRDRVFEGLVSPASARRERPANPALVKPVIERLGDTSDDNYALVKVHGDYFMGPLDGGFNTVRYRGTKALHVPVSRTTVWSWVPGISKGSAPVTVTTQDGRSEQVGFTVTKPWWKFW